MSIKKFFIQADTTVYNALKTDLSERVKGANTGFADSLEAFFLFGQDIRSDAVLLDKLDEARILIYPDLKKIWDHYTDAPSDTKFILKLFNAEHPFTLPKGFSLEVVAINTPWDEGTGLDMDNYSDVGAASWLERKKGVSWDGAGGDITTVAELETVGTVTFEQGQEDLELDITDFIINNWNGEEALSFILKLPSGLTDGSSEDNYYTKKFFSRSSEFFYKRPVIEARSSDSISDDRGRLYKSSPAYVDNSNSLYLYNIVDGQRVSFAALPSLDIFDTEDMSGQAVVTGVVTEEKTGVYKSDVEIPNTVTVDTVYERWTVNGVVVKTGPINLLEREPSVDTGSLDYFISITNLKNSYSSRETAKFRLYTRLKDWNPTIYTVATKGTENNIVDKTYYKIVRLVDDETVIDYGIGTELGNNEHTKLSYDATGNYFDFDMSLLEPGYMYGIKFMFLLNGEALEQPEIFKFRVD